RTLIRIVERLSNEVAAAWTPPAAPGSILFLGRAAALKSRLRHLPRSTTGNSRRAQVAAWLVIGTLAITGLTDANSDPNEQQQTLQTVFPVPQSATWRFSPAHEADDQP